jgi:DNA processing protein
MGVQVISGMAAGIDAAGQWGALQEGAYSLGILAGGVDVCYPRENLELYEQLQRQGGLLSENAPGTPPVPALFRLRNRLISGLADCVIVVEAREKSGTQITVNCALDQGKEVFALPGRITDPLSKGCNQMISQGARILWDFSELSEFFDMTDQMPFCEPQMQKLNDMEQLVYNRLTDEPRHFEELLRETGLPVGTLMEILLHLEIKGAARQQTKNYYRKCFRME